MTPRSNHAENLRATTERLALRIERLQGFAGELEKRALSLKDSTSRLRVSTQRLEQELAEAG